MADPLDDRIAREFPQGDLVYLNHAAVAPWPRCTMSAVAAFAHGCLTEAAWHYPAWLAVETELRARAARLLATTPERVALLKNTSEALSVVAHGFPWVAGDNVVFPAEEFPSNRIVWQSLAGRDVEARSVSLSGSGDPEEALLTACDRRTRLLAVSSVQYASGLRLDLGRLASAVRKAGIALCVDAIQGLGVLPHPVEDLGIDFLMADGHKWLLGPEGLALFYCSDAWRDRLVLHQFGWRMTAHPEDFDAPVWHPAPNARRFECGSPNMLGIHGLNASLGLIEDLGVDEIGRRILHRTELLIDALSTLPRVTVRTPKPQERRAGIVTFVPGARATWTPDAVFEALTSSRIFCARRGGGIRLSPHFYTPTEHLDRVISFIDTVT